MCQSEIREKSGISRKTNKPYSFYGCSNYPACNYIWQPEKRGTKETPKKEYDQGEIIIKGLREVYTKLLEMEQEQKEFFKIFGEKTNGNQ